MNRSESRASRRFVGLVWVGAACAVLGAGSQAALAQGYIYVDDSAPAGGSCLSWTSPCRFLQDALLKVQTSAAGTFNEIRIAKGTYRADQSASNPIGSGSRFATFFIDGTRNMNGVAIRGGYAGFGATNPDLRNFDLYKTILTGDLRSDDTAIPTTWTDNSYQVMVTMSLAATTSLSGVTIMGGNASDNGFLGGAAMSNVAGSDLLVEDCTFMNNHASGCGGAVWNDTSHGIFRRCTFLGNDSTNDAGAFCADSTYVKIENCHFKDNYASRHGGALLAQGRAIGLQACSFENNTAGANGGAVYAIGIGNTKFTNIAFYRNTATIGGAMFVQSSSPALTNTTMVGNAATMGGGLHASTALGIVLKNSILWGNTPDQIALYGGSTVTVASSNRNEATGLWWDPKFANVNVDDFTLLSTSPCKDTGDTTAPELTGITKDLVGSDRKYVTLVDMGAYEFSNCNDSNLCTIDIRSGTVCSYVPKDCDDEDPGTTDSCSLGVCTHVPTGGCVLNTDCADDGNACTSEVCSAGTCSNTPKPPGTICRAAAGVCDAAETCNGTASPCPADVLKSSTTVCRAAAAGGCDVAEYCTGTSAACPADALKSLGTLCRAATAGGCDVAENCTGASAACPADALKSLGTLCRAAAGACDVTENCTGSSAACPADAFKSSTTVCRAGVDQCDAVEKCSGTSATCPADVDVSNGTPCDDGDPWTVGDECWSGVCAGTLANCVVNTDCNDGKACTDDSCNPSTGQCVYTNDDTNICNDANACTTSDRCSAGLCVGTAVTCNDGKSCTDDSCNPSTGCVYTNDDTNICSDGIVATTNDKCSNGVCSGTVPTTCVNPSFCRKSSQCCTGFTCTTVSTRRAGEPYSCAVRTSATVSFGKHEPP